MSEFALWLSGFVTMLGLANAKEGALPSCVITILTGMALLVIGILA